MHRPQPRVAATSVAPAPTSPSSSWLLSLGFAGFGLAAAGAVAMLFVSGLLAACETQPLYVACQLDKDVTAKGLCKGSTAADRDTSSCVVRSHPQCDKSVCLSYYGTAPICTMTCDPSNEAACGDDATCWTYADEDPVSKAPAQRYCVPKAVMVAATK